MGDETNFNWTKEDIANVYKYENPNWSWTKCWNKAEVIYKELNKMNNKMWKDNKRFFKYHIPFSFYRSKDGELSSIPELDDVL